MQGHLNGVGHMSDSAFANSPPAGVSGDTVIAYYQPIAITPNLVKWVIGGIIGAIWSMYLAGWLFLPAKDTELQQVKGLVEIIKTEQQNNKQTFTDLKGAIDGLTSAVAEIQYNVRQTVDAPAAQAPTLVPVPRELRRAQPQPQRRPQQ